MVCGYDEWHSCFVTDAEKLIGYQLIGELMQKKSKRLIRTTEIGELGVFVCQWAN
jgi:hypothetical protein